MDGNDIRISLKMKNKKKFSIEKNLTDAYYTKSKC